MSGNEKKRRYRIKYDIGQEVIIIGPEIVGRVITITIDGKNNFYKLSYWKNNEQNEITCREDEVEAYE
ncbi:MAG: hypothetical protein ABIH23_11545 [bacterium]